MPDLRSLMLFSLALICQGYAQPTCPDIERAGSDLGICSTDEQQCCTQGNITSELGKAGQLLVEGLRLQMNVTNSKVSKIVASIINDTAATLRKKWITSRSLPIPGGIFNNEQYDEIFEALINNLAEHLVITNLTRKIASQFVQDIIDAFRNSAANVLAPDNSTRSQCVLDGIQNSFNQTATENMVSLIENVEKSVTTFKNIHQFLRNYTTDTNFTLPHICAEQLLKLGFCRQCIEKIPPLCTNTCSALARGCYSPYSDAWITEYDLVRNVSIQVLTILNNTLRTLLSDGSRLFQEETLKQSIQDCGVHLPSHNGVNGASATMLIPQERKKELNTSVSGNGLSYGVGGALICQPVVIPQPCTGSSFPSQTRDNCTADRICTSTCQCFDGKMRLTNDEVEKFTVTGIEGQSQNPAIDNLDIHELERIQASVGKPFRTFLMQKDVLAVLPEGVVIPPETPSDSSDNLATLSLPNKLVISIMLMLCFALVNCIVDQ